MDECTYAMISAIIDKGPDYNTVVALISLYLIANIGFIVRLSFYWHQSPKLSWFSTRMTVFLGFTSVFGIIVSSMTLAALNQA